MTAGECIRLEVYAEQYGVSSEKKVFDICYVGKIYTNINVSVDKICERYFLK